MGSSDETGPRVALVHDWLTGMRGGEKVLEVLCELYPDATLFTLLHNRGTTSAPIERMRIRTSFVQRLPLRRRQYRYYLPIFPIAIECLDLAGFDLVISSSHCVAKGVLTPAATTHICYCHTPMRYVWDMYDEYFGRGAAGPTTRAAGRLLRPHLRRWDVDSQRRVDHYVANSRYVAQRIEHCYGRTADVLYPPVDSDLFTLSHRNDGYYLVVSALVPYKRTQMAIEAFQILGERLLVAGAGPELESLKGLAPPNVEFLGWQSPAQLAALYAGCRAVVFPGIEDFGIVPVEAMATGKPVVACGAGGALETVVDGVTGVFFDQPTAAALADAVRRVARLSLDPGVIRRHALQFSRAAFKERLRRYIADRVGEPTRPHRSADQPCERRPVAG